MMMDKAKIAKYCSHVDNEKIRKRILDIIDELFSNQDDVVFIRMELKDLLSEFSALQREHRKRFKYLDSKVNKAPNPKDRLQPRKQKRAKNEIGLRKNEIENLSYALKYLRLQLDNDNFILHMKKKEESKQEIITDYVPEIKDLQLITPIQKFDPSKKVYSREEACEYLQISNRKMTTLLTTYKIKPVSTAVKPYTFNIEELERYRKDEI
ncbi:hypothetical protein [Dysgonomonas sp. 520]|uniref:hypothetical protein n=1 Tax=Dysgonomonas sp. 520 TaxID=2302931 RepID=UPI0013CF9ABC|nr:hypothetical protein [Dysgonomonas sp. 520]NDW08475.1 hypothetical protein [Dysgonomonas sp. 520]